MAPFCQSARIFADLGGTAQCGGMTQRFDKHYWDQHWRASADENPPNPYLAEEVGGLAAGTALDAGCGTGAEAMWLAAAGWQVTAVDISGEALGRAAERAGLGAGLDLGSESAPGAGSERVRWVEADLEVWRPEKHFDLVTTHYAHPAMPQLKFYERIAEWVAPGGTLLIVGHLHAAGDSDHAEGSGDHEHRPLAEAAVTPEAITALLSDEWRIVTAARRRRVVAGGHGGRAVELNDVVVRALRGRSSSTSSRSTTKQPRV